MGLLFLRAANLAARRRSDPGFLRASLRLLQRVTARLAGRNQFVNMRDTRPCLYYCCGSTRDERPHMHPHSLIGGTDLLIKAGSLPNEENTPRTQT